MCPRKPRRIRKHHLPIQNDDPVDGEVASSLESRLIWLHALITHDHVSVDLIDLVSIENNSVKIVKGVPLSWAF